MTATIQQHAIPAELVGELREAPPLDSPTAVRDELASQGYVLLRGILDRDEVLAARTEVFARLQEVGEIVAPAEEGIATGTSQRRQLYPDANEFWRSVSEGPLLRQVTHGPRLAEVVGVLLDQPARPHDLMYLRPTPVGRSTKLHYDYPFFARQASRIVTAWVPLGDILIEDGPLALVEGSHQFDDLLDPIRSVDYARDHSNDTVQQAAYDKQNEMDPVTLVESRGTRFLTTEFHAGDLIIFDGFTMHGSLDNRSAVSRVRLSVDVRFQPAADPADDERYFGPQPRGSKGGGYGDMRAAQPLAGD